MYSCSNASGNPEFISIVVNGVVLQVSRGAILLDVLHRSDPNMLKLAVAAKIDDHWIDLRQPIVRDCNVRVITIHDPDAVEIIRHSAEHVMASAVKLLWPDAKVDVGRSDHKEKFQYDFDLKHRLGPEDLEKISLQMNNIISQNVPFHRGEVSREEAISLYASMGESLKLSRLEDIPREQSISLFRCGSFVDLCRGPHVQHAGQIGAFKLLDVAGSYWKGDEKNPMLQRIFGIAFAQPQELVDWQQQRDQAEKRDHRKIGSQLDLFSIQEEVGGGLVLWHPKGALIRKVMEDYWREEHLQEGYQLVNSPHLGRSELWKTSGHLEFYQEGMFAPMEIDGNAYYVKPMSCPFHAMIFKHRPHSYRELPIRLAELAAVYRYEQSGVLHGLMRVRGFTQDDSHIFCAPEQVESEILKVVKLALRLLRKFGFSEVRAFVSTKPSKAVGSDEMWEKATNSLKQACAEAKLTYEIDEGGGAFYGPKIDFKIKDAIGREWQCSTIQFDFNLPKRFGLSYVGSDNQPHCPYVIHRALYGSMERFFGILIEHHAGAFPFWLAPVQLRLLSVSDAQNSYAHDLAKRLSAEGFRVDVDVSNEKLGWKIREAQMLKIPCMAVVGKREVESQEVSLRLRSGESLGAMSVGILIDRMRKGLTGLDTD